MSQLGDLFNEEYGVQQQTAVMEPPPQPTKLNMLFKSEFVGSEHKEVTENKAKMVLPAPQFPAGTPRDIRPTMPEGKSMVGFGESVREEFTRPAKGAQYMPLLGGVIGTAENLLYLDAADRLRSEYDYSKPVSPETFAPGAAGIKPAIYSTKEKDQKLIEDFIVRTARQREGYTFGGKVAKGVLNLPTWMAEFAMTGGLATLGSNTAKKAGEKLISRWAKTKAGQIALKGAGWTGGAITRATLGLAPRITERATERQVGVQILGAEQEGWATSFAKAWGDVTIEAASETAGQAITSMPIKILKKSKLGGQFLNALQKGWMKATGGSAGAFAKQMITKGGYSNIIGEMGEEWLGTTLRAITDVEDFGAGKDAGVVERLSAGLKEHAKNVGVEAVVLSTPMGAQAILGQAGKIISRPEETPPQVEAVPEKPPTKPAELAKAKPTEAIAPAVAEGKVLYTDEFGKKIAKEIGDYKISINRAEKPTYFAVWKDNKKVGTMTIASKAVAGADDYVIVEKIEINKTHQNRGLATELLRTLSEHLPQGKKGIMAYAPEIIATKKIPHIFKKLGAFKDPETGNLIIPSQAPPAAEKGKGEIIPEKTKLLSEFAKEEKDAIDIAKKSKNIESFYVGLYDYYLEKERVRLEKKYEGADELYFGEPEMEETAGYLQEGALARIKEKYGSYEKFFEQAQPTAAPQKQAGKKPAVKKKAKKPIPKKKPASGAGGEIATSIGAARSPQLDRILTEAAHTTAETYVRQLNGKWIKAKKQPLHGDYYRIKNGIAKFIKGKNAFETEKQAIFAAKDIAKNTIQPVYVWQTTSGFRISDTKPKAEYATVKPKGKGLTREERRILGTPQKIAEAEIAQEEKQKVGYKTGHKAGIAESRKKLDAFRLAQQLTDKHRQDALDIVKQYVPKDQQYRYTKRILSAKTNKRIERLTEAINAYLDKADYRQAVRDFRKFVKDTRSKYRRGETELGKLRSDVRDKLLSVLGKYDVSKLSEAKREQLESRQDYIKNVSGTVADAFESLAEDGIDILQMPDARITELTRLSKTHIGELDADQTRYIQASLEQLIAVAGRKGDIKERIRAEKVRDLVHTARAEVSQKAKDTGVVIEKRGAFGFAGKMLTTAQATPRTLVGMFTGKDNSATIELITNRLYEGHERKTGKARELILAARKELSDAGLDNKAFSLLDKKIKITLGSKTFKTDLDNLLSIYMHIKAEGNLRRLLKTKGLDITLYERDPSNLYTIKRKTTIMTGRPQLSEIRGIVNVVESKYPVLKTIADTAFKINRKYQAPAINETSMEHQNYEIARSEKYWPVHRARAKSVEGKATNISVSIENQGRYLPRTGGSDRIRISPFRQEFIAGIQSDSTYYGMTMPMRDLRALVGDKVWQDKMRKAGRGREMDALITMLRRIQGHSTDQNFIDAAGAKVLSNFGKSVLSLRLSGYGVQTASIPAAFEVIEPKYFFKAGNIVRLPKIPIAAVKEMMNLSPRLWMRWTGRQFDFVTGGAAAQHAFDTLIFEGSTITEKGVKHYTWGDQKAIYHIYIAAKNKVAAETGLKKGSTELKEKAIKLTERSLETQPQWDMVFRSGLTSSPNVFLRGSVMFMSARNAQYNVLLRAVDDYKKGRINSTKFGKRVSGVLYANTLVAVVKRLVKLGVKAAALGLIFAIGSEDEKGKTKLVAQKEAAKLKGQIPLDAALNLISLPAFGGVAQNMAYEAIRRYKYNYPTHKLQDIRTGNIFADLSLDATGIVADTAQLTKQVIADEYFKSGPDKGKPKWHRTAKQVADGIAGLIAVAAGLPYSAPRGEAYYQVKSAEKAVAKTMTVPELKQAIKTKTYNRRYKRDGKWYPKGHAHKGQEVRVKELRAELASRE